MPDHAHVESVDALKRLRIALIKFAENICVALDESDAEVQRADAWLKLEQPGHWKQQVNVRSELHTRAKSELNRKKMQTSGLKNKPSCIEEIKALARAEHALEEARHKQGEVRRWTPLFDQEYYSYAAAVQRLRTAAQTEMPRAVAQLDAMIAAIEAYAPTPQWQGSTSGSQWDDLFGEAGGMARGETDPATVSSFCAMLRRQAPTANERTTLLSAPDSGPAADLLAAISGGEGSPSLIDRSTLATLLGANRTAPSTDDFVIVALEDAAGPQIFLERQEPAGPGDSGWYIGSVNGGPAPRRSVIRVRDLLVRSPILEPILAFPPGWLCILAGAAGPESMRVEALFDGATILRWSGGEVRDAPHVAGESKPRDSSDAAADADMAAKASDR